jgi:hypothetical protein
MDARVRRLVGLGLVLAILSGGLSAAWVLSAGQTSAARGASTVRWTARYVDPCHAPHAPAHSCAGNLATLMLQGTTTVQGSGSNRRCDFESVGTLRLAATVFWGFGQVPMPDNSLAYTTIHRSWAVRGWMRYCPADEGVETLQLWQRGRLYGSYSFANDCQPSCAESRVYNLVNIHASNKADFRLVRAYP